MNHRFEFVNGEVKYYLPSDKKDLIGMLVVYCCSGTMHVSTQPFFPYVVISNCKMSDYKVINLHYLTIITNTLDETIDFCKQVNLIHKQVKCPNCRRILIKPYLVNRSKGDGHEIRYQCNRKMCRGRGIKM